MSVINELIIGNYRIQNARKTGGKAGKGKNKTSTVQVIYKDSFIVKQFRYDVAQYDGWELAMDKAIKWANSNTPVDKRLMKS